MSDERIRRLERRAAAGDIEAAEALGRERQRSLPDRSVLPQSEMIASLPVGEDHWETWTIQDVTPMVTRQNPRPLLRIRARNAADQPREYSLAGDFIKLFPAWVAQCIRADFEYDEAVMRSSLEAMRNCVVRVHIRNVQYRTKAFPRYTPYPANREQRYDARPAPMQPIYGDED